MLLMSLFHNDIYHTLYCHLKQHMTYISKKQVPSHAQADISRETSYMQSPPGNYNSNIHSKSSVNPSHSTPLLSAAASPLPVLLSANHRNQQSYLISFLYLLKIFIFHIYLSVLTIYLLPLYSFHFDKAILYPY